jgi:hypothetical protein
MAVVKQGRREQRRAPADERPWSLIDLLWGLTGDRERAYIFIEIIACTTLILCTPACLGVDAVALAAKGMKGLTLGTLLPGGFFGGGWLTYLAIRIKRRLTSRRHDADSYGRNTTTRSSDPNHKQGQRQRKPRPVRQPTRRYEPSRQPQSSQPPRQSSRSHR